MEWGVMMKDNSEQDWAENMVGKSPRERRALGLGSDVESDRITLIAGGQAPAQPIV